MKNLHVAALATLFGISAASGIALTQAQHPANASGIFVATAAIASADQNGNGNWQNNQNGQNGQCNTNGNTRRSNGNGDENNNNQGNQGNRGAGHGKKRGWQNPNNPHNCGYNGNGNCNNGQNNGQYSGQQNGQYGQYNCNPNGTNGQGNSVLRGTITSVNGNQVRLMAGFGSFVTINDQPALNNQQTGRVVVGRYVTAYGYYQNGIFYATSLQ
jgi:hypothetical protein